MKHLMYTYPPSSSDLLSSFILAGPFGLVLGTQWAQQPTPRFDARAISVVTQYPLVGELKGLPTPICREKSIINRANVKIYVLSGLKYIYRPYASNEPHYNDPFGVRPALVQHAQVHAHMKFNIR